MTGARARKGLSGLAVFTAAAALMAVGATAVLAAGPAEGLKVVSAPATALESSLTLWKSAVLGIVEGLTEYLPISSTAHLLIASDLMGLGTSKAQQKAVDTYAIAIQFGAILAVAGLFWKRFRDMLLGLVGKSEEGRHLLIILVIAFLPAAVLGFIFKDMIESALFGPAPIVFAWAVGGLLILWLERSGRIQRGGTDSESVKGDPLMQITIRQAAIIGLIQCIAMWPGTSRSLAAILGALLVGVTLSAAVEFSFLLGFVTLSAASVFAVMKDGKNLVDQFGILNPAVGMVFAFLAAVAAIKWMISYLQKRDLSIFGWYRIVAAGLVAGLLISGALKV